MNKKGCRSIMRADDGDERESERMYAFYKFSHP